jgi:hypothetical protein
MKAVLIYRRTGNLRAVELRYLGIQVDDAIEPFCGPLLR